MIPADSKPMFRFLAVMTAASMVGLQGYTILFNNYAVEVIGLNGNKVGMIQSIREVPGFLALCAVFLMLFIKEHRLSALSIALLGIGTGITGLFPSYFGLACTTLLMSFGFHYYETTNQSLTLQYFSTGVSPVVFGKLRSLAAASSIASGILIWLLGLILDYRGIFLVVGSLVFVAGIWGLLQEPTHDSLTPQRQQMFLKRKYSLYYILTFLSGARRQIFMVFSIFLLVKIFHYSVREMTLLFIINNAIAWVLNPLIGKAIIRFGERRVSSIEYVGVVIIFAVYAFTDSKLLVAAMYILDSILFNFSVAIRTYFQKIGEPGDIASSMAVGFTINHIAAVFLPALGGYFWMIDYRIPFLTGAALGIVSLIAAQFMRTHHEPQEKIDDVLPPYTATETEQV
ncbi:MFS transporter [Pelotalea chapellei]|uniref:MFS transporter n=1 Tax=Pelotalea chapellei TaxID=44671 RepID=A0ABS5UC01_9BACT|nr:MFS transporter [Pelotalea chapellei]MBT1073218.1 MFS transporter [Pelotalea chapellei]